MNSKKKTKPFDLFTLHSKHDKINGWIWVRIRTKLFKDKLNKYIIKTSWNFFCKKLSNELQCGFSTIGKYIIRIKYSKREAKIPLCFLAQLSACLDLKKEEVLEVIQHFELNSDSTSTKIKPNHCMTAELSVIAGAFAADGYLQQEESTYRLKIVEGEESCIRQISTLIENSFGIVPRVYYDQKENCWYCWFNSKVIARYFIEFFGFTPGKKFDTVKEPDIIKTDFKLRKAFAQGVLTFDGGVKKSGTVGFSTRSERLFKDIVEILEIDGLRMRKRYNPKKHFWSFESTSGRDKDALRKWATYFVPRTIKRERLEFFLNERTYTKEEVLRLFPKHYKATLSVGQIYEISQEIESFDAKRIKKRLESEGIHVTYESIFKYKYIALRIQDANNNPVEIRASKKSR